MRVYFLFWSTGCLLLHKLIHFLSDPPEKPEIQGYMEGETIRMGQTVTLVCESFGGNPLASIVWYKNNQRIDHSYTTSGIAVF